jgi:hypothetical protein
MAKIHLRPWGKYPLRCADFNETQNWSTVLHGSFIELGREM